ncbi:hypothetical protein Tco_0068189, partial [Tanacetum coccineum]
MASLQIENAHLKQTHKDLFESVQSSRVETIQCDEVKIKFEFDKIETQNIELEHQVASLLKENEHLKLTYQNLFDSIKKLKFNNILGKIESLKKNQFDSFSRLNVVCNSSELETESEEKNNLFESETCVLQTKIVELEKTLEKQTKENSDLLMKVDNLENAFADEVKRATMGKLTAFDKDNCVFRSKVTHLEKIIAQKTKDFDDVKLELSNITAKFEAYFEKLENTKVVLERQLACKVDDSKAEKDQFLKEINHLRAQFGNLKGKFVETKFDKSLILGKPPQLSKSWFTPKVVVQKDLSKPVTTQSLPRNKKDQLLKR